LLTTSISAAQPLRVAPSAQRPSLTAPKSRQSIHPQGIIKKHKKYLKKEAKKIANLLK
jgi:hypothetical protein